jgi:hypothetical protein
MEGNYTTRMEYESEVWANHKKWAYESYPREGSPKQEEGPILFVQGMGGFDNKEELH